MSPFFSVCVPVYNGETYLRQCLDSILSQSFRDFEVVIVDDGSSDNSPVLVQEYVRKDNRIRFYKNKRNLGLVRNWNQCIKHAEGSWVKFLFQDDLWSPSALETVHAHTAGASLIFHARQFLFEGEVDPALTAFYTSKRVNDHPGLRGQKTLSTDKIRELIGQDLCFNFFGEPSNVAFERKLIGQFGYFDDRLVQLCDFEYWCRIASNRGAVYIDSPQSVFRVHNKATSSVNLSAKKFRFELLDPLILMQDFLKKDFYAILRTDGEDVFEKKLQVRYREYCEVAAESLTQYPLRERQQLCEEIRKLSPPVYAALARAKTSVRWKTAKRIFNRLLWPRSR